MLGYRNKKQKNANNTSPFGLDKQAGIIGIW